MTSSNMVTLFCWIFNERDTFPIQISKEGTIGELKEAILAKNSNHFKGLDAFKLRLWKKVVLDEDIYKIKLSDLPSNDELRAVRKIVNYFWEDLPADSIHIVIQAPIEDLPAEPTQRKRKRWAALNSILDKNKRAKTTDGALSTAYSYVSWEDIRSVYEPILRKMTIEPKEVPAEVLESLYKYLCRAAALFEPIHLGKEAKRLHLVAPILIHVGGLFNDMRILIEQRIPGKNIHTDGNFEFVVEIGGKKMCIIEAKKDDMEQGWAQDLLGCEAVADTEHSTCVLGIVTNYLQWSFFKSHEDCIELEDITLQIESEMPTKAGLKMLAEKIYSLLSDG